MSLLLFWNCSILLLQANLVIHKHYLHFHYLINFFFVIIIFMLFFPHFHSKYSYVPVCNWRIRHNGRCSSSLGPSFIQSSFPTSCVISHFQHCCIPRLCHALGAWSSCPSQIFRNWCRVSITIMHVICIQITHHQIFLRMLSLQSTQRY